MTELEDIPVERRRALVVLTPEDARIARMDQSIRGLLDGGQTAIVELPVPGQPARQGSLLEQLIRLNKVRPGALLVQSPFNPDEYEYADAAATTFAVEKGMLLSELCQLLGAKSVETERVAASRDKSGSQQGFRGRVRGVVFAARVSRDIEKRVRDSLRVSDQFPGTEPDVAEAVRFLARNGLEGDSTLASLVRLRERRNSLHKRDVVVSLTQESTENLKVAADASGFRMVKVGAEFARTVEQQIEVRLTISIEF